MRAKETVTTAATGVAERSPDRAGVQLGIVVELLPDGTPQIEIAPSRQRLAARLAVGISRERIETAIALQQQVVVQFEDGQRTKPIVMGFIERLGDSPHPETEVQP